MNRPSPILTRLRLQQEKTYKSFAVLVDPDKVTEPQLDYIIELGLRYAIDYFLVGGSLITGQGLSAVITKLTTQKDIPVIIFPGNNSHIDHRADGILLLSLISGRNPDLLIGQHIMAAPILKNSPLEVMATGYMLIDGGRQTTVSYISNTTPIPRNKPEIAACTAMAGEMLGLKLIYIDTGSGAEEHAPAAMIKSIRKHIDIPLVAGGGIRTAEQAKTVWQAGADLIVMGNSLETNPDLMQQIAQQRDELNKKQQLF